MVGATQVKSRQGIGKRAAFEMHSFSHANPAAAIEFSLPRSDRVTINVYDLSGNEIVSLVNNSFEPGIHSILWNARNLAAGCYTVKMQAGPDICAKTVPVFR
jgi:flagellar hook assembly protein FlgD